MNYWVYFSDYKFEDPLVEKIETVILNSRKEKIERNAFIYLNKTAGFCLSPDEEINMWLLSLFELLESFDAQKIYSYMDSDQKYIFLTPMKILLGQEDCLFTFIEIFKSIEVNKLNMLIDCCRVFNREYKFGIHKRFFNRISINVSEDKSAVILVMFLMLQKIFHEKVEVYEKKSYFLAEVFEIIFQDLNLINEILKTSNPEKKLRVDLFYLMTQEDEKGFWTLWVSNFLSYLESKNSKRHAIFGMLYKGDLSSLKLKEWESVHLLFLKYVNDTKTESDDVFYYDTLRTLSDLIK